MMPTDPGRKQPPANNCSARLKKTKHQSLQKVESDRYDMCDDL